MPSRSVKAKRAAKRAAKSTKAKAEKPTAKKARKSNTHKSSSTAATTHKSASTARRPRKPASRASQPWMPRTVSEASILAKHRLTKEQFQALKDYKAARHRSLHAARFSTIEYCKQIRAALGADRPVDKMLCKKYHPRTPNGNVLAVEYWPEDLKGKMVELAQLIGNGTNSPAEFINRILHQINGGDHETPELQRPLEVYDVEHAIALLVWERQSALS